MFQPYKPPESRVAPNDSGALLDDPLARSLAAQRGPMKAASVSMAATALVALGVAVWSLLGRGSPAVAALWLVSASGAAALSQGLWRAARACGRLQHGQPPEAVEEALAAISASWRRVTATLGTAPALLGPPALGLLALALGLIATRALHPWF
ncbi:MAG: hypothetical protein H6740_23295 [Alphaproteobacteria bacterium]|nr:hypothetical protein [Alphaproteobacteria bacterium]